MIREDTSRLNSPKMEYYREVYKNSPRWNGSDSLNDKHLVVYCEQGLGDQIQFARYIPELMKTYNCKVTMHCSRELHRLFEHMNVERNILDRDDPDVPEHDCHIPSMSLPFALQNVDAPEDYLRDVGHEDFEEGEYVYRIGIAWEGSPNHSNNDERSCPLKHFFTLRDALYNSPIPVKFFSLHREHHDPTLLEGAEDFELYGADLSDMLDTAKLINSMNAVVSVDTSVLHLAATLKKPTWGMLSHRHDYRWTVKQWYKTLTLVSQPSYNDWQGVMSEVVSHFKDITQI